MVDLLLLALLVALAVWSTRKVVAAVKTRRANAERAAALTAMYEEGIELAKLLLEAF